MIIPPLGYVEVEAATPEYLTVPGIDPYSFTSDGQFRISTATLRSLEDNGPVEKFYDACLICDALERPTVILEGLKRANYEDGLCYCFVPAVRYTMGIDMQTVAPPRGMVFAVYVKPNASDLYVLDWDWRRVGPDATGIPHRWPRDFERIVWPTS